MDHKKQALAFLGLMAVVSATCLGTISLASQNTVISKPHPQSEAVQIVTKVVPELKTYTDEEREILALIIYQEAGADYCLDSTRQMVGEVFLNRVSSSNYPDTFREVATQRSQYGRLHWTGIKWPERANRPEEQHAIKRAYATADALLSGTAERLLPTDAIYQAEFAQGSEILAFQDGTYFCR